MTFKEIAAAALLACPQTQTPQEIDDLMVWGLFHLGQDEAHCQDFVDAAQTQLRDHAAPLQEGLPADVLTAERLEEHGLSASGAGGELMGLVASARHQASFDDVVRVITGDMSKVIPTTDVYEITTEDDRACFLARLCDTYRQQVTRVTRGAWGTGDQQVSMTFRWAALRDGTEVLVYQGLAPEPVNTRSMVFRIHQHYQVYTLVDGPDGPEKLEAHWIEARVLGMGMPKSVARKKTVQGIRDQAAHIDAFIARGGTN